MFKEKIVHFSLDEAERQGFKGAVERYGFRAGHELVATAPSLMELEKVLDDAPENVLILFDHKNVDDKNAGEILRLLEGRRAIIYNSEKKALRAGFMDTLTHLRV